MFEIWFGSWYDGEWFGSEPASGNDLSSAVSGSSSLAGTLIATASMSSSIVGSGDLAGILTATTTMSSSIAGSGDLAGTLTIGSAPSPATSSGGWGYTKRRQSPKTTPYQPSRVYYNAPPLPFTPIVLDPSLAYSEEDQEEEAAAMMAFMMISSIDTAVF